MWDFSQTNVTFDNPNYLFDGSLNTVVGDLPIGSLARLIKASSRSLKTKPVAARLIYTYDWSDAIPAGVDLTSVQNIVPPDLVTHSQGIDTVAQLSAVELGDGVNGDIYEIGALATLSNGEEIPASFTLRVFG